MLLKLEKRVADFITANNMFDVSSGILLAVSGGADSMSLMYIMKKLRDEKIINAPLYCAHINHQLRQDKSQFDEDFVTGRAKQLGLPVITRKIDVRSHAERKKLSIETAARELRIKALIDIAKQNNCNVIATGHQKDDNAETVIFRLLRGTGYRGLSGIWPVKQFHNNIKFARPLLLISRYEIIQYLNSINSQWAVDDTNSDCSYTRNFIRHLLLPDLQNKSKDILTEQLCNLAESAYKYYKQICVETDIIWPCVADCKGEKVLLDNVIFTAQSRPVKIDIIRHCLDYLNCGQANFTQRHYCKILELSEASSVRTCNFPGNLTVKRIFNKLVFSVMNEKSCRSDIDFSVSDLNVPGSTKFGDIYLETEIIEVFESESFKSYIFSGAEGNFIEYFDIDKLNLPLFVRYRRNGDRFFPLGHINEKKVGKFLTAQKVPVEIRHNILVVCDSIKIIWLCPIRISELAGISKDTQRILKIRARLSI